MPMFGKMFTNVDLMARGMDAAWKRQEVSAHNIANADTPNFKASHVEFETMMQAALKGDGNLAAAVTHQKHLVFGGKDPTSVKPVVANEWFTTTRMDGNNVNVDSEMADFAENYIRYSALTTQVNSEFAKLRTVIKEQA